MPNLFDIERSEYWVAEKSGTIVGGCGLYPIEGLYQDCVELVKFYLSPLERSRGVGLKLINLAIGYKQLYLEQCTKS